MARAPESGAYIIRSNPRGLHKRRDPLHRLSPRWVLVWELRTCFRAQSPVPGPGDGHSLAGAPAPRCAIPWGGPGKVLRLEPRAEWGGGGARGAESTRGRGAWEAAILASAAGEARGDARGPSYRDLLRGFHGDGAL